MNERGGHGGGGVWLISYADMVTLMLAFFIVMYTMSQIDIHKLQALVGSLNATFDPRPDGNKVAALDTKRRAAGEASLVPGGAASIARAAPSNGVAASKGPGKHSKPSRAQKNLQEVVDEVREVARRAGLEGQVHARLDPRGAVLSFSENADGVANVVPFASGSAELTDGFRRFLAMVAPILQQCTNKIEIQGHTDRRPIRTLAFPSNWELSGARAGSVVRYFVMAHAMSPRQFVCTGFADTAPVDAADTPRAWARNRRIEIVLTRHPIDSYDSMTRAESSTTEADITQPLGPRMFPLLKPEPGEPAAKPGETATMVDPTAPAAGHGGETVGH